jgi:integrase
MRKLGPRRTPGDSVGLTRKQAEAELRRLVGEEQARPVKERLDLETIAPRYLAHKQTQGVRPHTLKTYEMFFRVHLVPFFGARSLDAVTPHEVENFLSMKLREGKSRKTIDHLLGLLSAVYRYAVKRGYARINPVELADRPRQQRPDADIRYLTIEELEAVLRHVPDDEFGRMERVLYLTAAMTGLRRGELVALRWQDVDWFAGLIRVRRSYGSDGFGPPKSRRSSRAVPMADRVAAELEHRYVDSAFRADDDLVFGHPQLGTAYDPSKLRKRFAQAAERAGLRSARFHDLRHTFGTQMAAAGAPIRAIQEWMGHADYRTTTIYADYAPDPSRGVLYARRAFGALRTHGEDDLMEALSPVTPTRASSKAPPASD